MPYSPGIHGGTLTGNLTVTGNLVVQGNTTLGDSSADTLTINAGTWTYGANWTATRSVGALAAGNTNILNITVTATGDAGGTSSPRFENRIYAVQGANPVVTSFGQLNYISNSSTATVGGMFYAQTSVRAASSGTIANASVTNQYFEATGAGGIGAATAYAAGPPVISGGGFITLLQGFRVTNLGNAAVSTAIGFKIDDFSNSTTMRGIQSSLSSGVGKYNLYIEGTADNSFAGAIYPAKETKVLQANAAIYAGNGVPNNANGNNGDFYFRGDGTQAGNTVIYHKEGGAWVALVTT